MGPWGAWHDWEVSSLPQLQGQPTARPGAGQDLRPWAPGYTACPGVQEAPGRRGAREPIPSQPHSPLCTERWTQRWPQCGARGSLCPCPSPAPSP